MSMSVDYRAEADALIKEQIVDTQKTLHAAKLKDPPLLHILLTATTKSVDVDNTTV